MLAADSPGSDAAAAADGLVRRINEGLLPVPWQDIEAAFQARVEEERTATDLLLHAGYDPDDRLGRDAALQAWSFALPRSLRGLTHAGWAGRLGLPGMLSDRISRHAANVQVLAADAAATRNMRMRCVQVPA